MKKLFVLIAIASVLLSSCYTYVVEFGDGPQSYVETEKGKNHYFLWGLVAGNTSDPYELADGEENYKATIKHTFLDGFLNLITFGIYTPTTTEITK